MLLAIMLLFLYIVAIRTLDLDEDYHLLGICIMAMMNELKGTVSHQMGEPIDNAGDLATDASIAAMVAAQQAPAVHSRSNKSLKLTTEEAQMIQETLDGVAARGRQGSIIARENARIARSAIDLQREIAANDLTTAERAREMGDTIVRSANAQRSLDTIEGLLGRIQRNAAERRQLSEEAALEGSVPEHPAPSQAGIEQEIASAIVEQPLPNYPETLPMPPGPGTADERMDAARAMYGRFERAAIEDGAEGDEAQAIAQEAMNEYAAEVSANMRRETELAMLGTPPAPIEMMGMSTVGERQAEALALYGRLTDHANHPPVEPTKPKPVTRVGKPKRQILRIRK
jgi:hypothetical protein